MPSIGRYKAQIVKNQFLVDDKARPYINITFKFPDNSIMFSKVYCNEAAAGIARAKFRAVGLDLPNTEEGLQKVLLDISNSDLYLAGKVAEVEVKQSESGYLNCDIITSAPKANRDAIMAAAKALFTAKSKDKEPAQAKAPAPAKDEDADNIPF